MAHKHTRISEPQRAPDFTTAHFVRVHFKTMEIPPVKDGVVIGRAAIVSADTMLQILKLVSGEQFLRFEIKDEIVACMLVREAVVKKLQAAAIERFILKRVKPFMSESEILALHLDIEIVVEDVL